MNSLICWCNICMYVYIKFPILITECTEQSLSNELLGGLKLEKVVDLRRQEVLHVKREQKYLGVLLDMLRKVQCYLKGIFLKNDNNCKISA